MNKEPPITIKTLRSLLREWGKKYRSQQELIAGMGSAPSNTAVICHRLKNANAGSGTNPNPEVRLSRQVQAIDDLIGSLSDANNLVLRLRYVKCFLADDTQELKAYGFEGQFQKALNRAEMTLLRKL